MLPFSEKKRLEWLWRCEGQLDIYLYGEHDVGNCPICKNNPCRQCLWMLFENTTCINYAEQVFPINPNGETTMETEEWRQFRIPHLRGWIARLRYGETNED
jgi:hypothetical protein